MKNRILTAGAVLLLLFLAGCSSKDGSGGKAFGVSGGTAASCNESRYFNGVSGVIETDDGYYGLRMTTGGRYMIYAPKGSDTFIYLCGKPDCSHADEHGSVLESCNSYLGRVITDSLRYYNGSLYVLLYDDKTYEVSLARINRDGGTREKLFTVGRSEDNGSHVFQYIVNGDSVFVLYTPNKVSSASPSELSRWRLADGKKEVILQNSEIGYSSLKLYDNKLFCKYRQPQGEESSILMYDISGKNTKEFSDSGIISYTINSSANSVLYWKVNEGLISYDLMNGEKKLIKQCDETNMYSWVACNGKYVYLDNLLTRRIFNEDIELKLEILDASDGHTITSIKFADKGFSQTEFCGDDYVLASRIGNDGNKLFYIKNSDVADNAQLVWQEFTLPQMY